MEATGLSVGKSVLNGALTYATSAIAQEVALQLGVQRDQAFIRDELEMMLSFLMAAHEERDDHKVVKTWVKQVRDVAYDVEDCLQDQAVRLGKPSRWCFLRTLVDRRRVATWMKELLRAKVEDVSQERASDTGAGPSSIIPSATMFGIEEARRQKDKAKVELSQLINEGNEDLRVVAVWGTSGVLGQAVVIKGVYDDLKRSKKFELFAWIRIVHPFNPLELLQCIMRQFYGFSFQEIGKSQEKTNIGAQVLKNMGMMKQDDLVDAFSKHVNEKSYLIVLNEMFTIEEWEAIKEYFPDKKKGSRIIVSTEHGEVASLCSGQESIVSQSQAMLTKPGPSSSEAIIGGNNSLVLTDEIHENQYGGDNEKMLKKSLTRKGTITGALRESQLVGREKEKVYLINLILKKDDQQPVVISVCGMGGLGKTTLVKEIYQSQELGGLFEKRACVTIMRPFVLQEVLKSIAMQLDADSSNVEALGNILATKRFLIVLDDLSSVGEWDMIIKILPKIMESASRIIITTRDENIARHCSRKQENIYKLEVLKDSDALDLFTRKVFKESENLDDYPTLIEEAKMILKKCNGLPLAIVTIGGFLAKQPKTYIVWRKMNECISAELEMNPELGMIRAILMKSYDGLPYHLKSCFLYMSIFPEDYSISRRRLVRRWEAEGYSIEVRGKSMREITDSYFKELIERSMVLPSRESISSIIGSRKGISSCKLHDLMREISISKAMEENLVFRMEEGCSLNTQGTIRHLAISSNWEGDQSEFESTVDLSRVRSLTVFGKWKPFYISDMMKLLRVLDLESTSGLVDHHLAPIWKLLHLKYLSLRDCRGIFHLPESLGNLKQLETLDVTNTRIIKLPRAITKLMKLQHRGDEESINRHDVCTYYCCAVLPFVARLADPIGVTVPRGLRKLKALHTLGIVNIARGKAILQDIRSLTRLRKLAVTGINKKNCKEFCSVLASLSSLESLSVQSVDQKEGLGDCLDSLPTPPENLQSLKLFGPLVKLPKWVAGLQNLVKLRLKWTRLTKMDATIQVLGKLPNLAILRLLDHSSDARHLSFRREAFPSLTALEIDGWGNGIKSVQFEEGAAPKLELLLYRGRITFSGLSSLPDLKEVVFIRWFPRYGAQTKSVAEWEEDLRAQLDNHPKKPVLKFIK
ncbi:hypothetical protein BDA96_02G073300 [Sorghum bicolor]|uniref:Disease resistance protein RPM1 n=2 Tax=Sorghum bicolor TaxID=4558 RepID=A0A921RLT9_SORBI|nr:hypothetical protein BDA96_02G073300 [Sorghum bicolor]KXG34642.1 hypothetical protein SORBI_3002G071700 [Sorghum bicolor]